MAAWGIYEIQVDWQADKSCGKEVRLLMQSADGEDSLSLNQTSMVVIVCPTAAPAVNSQDFSALPLIITVQAQQTKMPPAVFGFG